MIEFFLFIVFFRWLLQAALVLLVYVIAIIFGFFIISIEIFVSIFYFGYGCESELICFYLYEITFILCYHIASVCSIIILTSISLQSRLLIYWLQDLIILKRLMTIFAFFAHSHVLIIFYYCCHFHYYYQYYFY